MSSERTSATSNDRFRQRQRSGVRSALIWGGVLLAALSIYLIAYALTRHFTHLAWAKAINAALKAQDTAQSAALLQACRREQPALSKKPQFVMWQNQLAVLQQNQAQKSAIFQHKLAQLRQLLEKPDAVNMQVWPLQLAETARYAATETELSQLRSIQLQCEALNRRQQLRHTQIAAELLQYINSQLKVLSRLRQQNNPAEHRNLSTKCNNILQELQQNYPAVPEIAQQALQLRKQLQHENSQLQQHEQQLQAENHAFRQILNSAFAAEAVTRAKDFLQRYPQSKYSAGVGNMLQSIQLLEQLQHDRSLSDRIAAMEQKNQQAIAFWRKEFARIMQTALQGTVFELVIFRQKKIKSSGLKLSKKFLFSLPPAAVPGRSSSIRRSMARPQEFFRPMAAAQLPPAAATGTAKCSTRPDRRANCRQLTGRNCSINWICSCKHWKKLNSRTGWVKQQRQSGKINYFRLRCSSNC